MASLVLLVKVVVEQRHLCCSCWAHRASSFRPSAEQGQDPGPVLAPEEMVCAQGGPSLRSLRHEPALTAHGLGLVGSELICWCDRGLGQGGL